MATKFEKAKQLELVSQSQYERMDKAVREYQRIPLHGVCSYTPNEDGEFQTNFDIFHTLRPSFRSDSPWKFDAYRDLNDDLELLNQEFYDAKSYVDGYFADLCKDLDMYSDIMLNSDIIKRFKETFENISYAIAQCSEFKTAAYYFKSISRMIGFDLLQADKEDLLNQVYYVLNSINLDLKYSDYEYRTYTKDHIELK